MEKQKIRHASISKWRWGQRNRATEVRPSNVDKKVEVMFRARNVFTDVAIKVRSNGEELASFKREHMAPGEMEKIVIPKAFLDKVRNGEITVSVEKVGA